MRGAGQSTARFKVAVIGAGDMGSHHVSAWRASGHDVVSVTDVDAARAGDLAARFGITRICADYRDAVADPTVDLVSICLPLAFHAPVTICAAGHGKHVFTEKPLARTLTEAREMEAAVTRTGVAFGVGFQRNLAAGVSLLRRWAAEGRFGRPMVFNSDLLQEVRPKRAMHDRNGNNGPFTDAGCHYYLMWQTVFRSKPKTVYAQGRILATERPEVADFAELAIDTGVVTIEYESGDIGTLTASWGLAEHFQMHPRPDRIFGPKGGAEGGVNGRLTLYEQDRVETVEFEREDLHQVQCARFAQAIAAGTPAPSCFREGKQMIAVTEAIFRSIDSGKVVPVCYDF